MYPEYIGPHKKITGEEFNCLIEKSGGWEGHVQLYIFSLKYLKIEEEVMPDFSCLESLRMSIIHYSISTLF